MFWNKGRGTRVKIVSSTSTVAHWRLWVARWSNQTTTGTLISSQGSCRRVIQGCHLIKAVKSPQEAHKARMYAHRVRSPFQKASGVASKSTRK